MLCVMRFQLLGGYRVPQTATQEEMRHIQACSSLKSRNKPLNLKERKKKTIQPNVEGNEPACEKSGLLFRCKLNYKAIPANVLSRASSAMTQMAFSESVSSISSIGPLNHNAPKSLYWLHFPP